MMRNRIIIYRKSPNHSIQHVWCRNAMIAISHDIFELKTVVLFCFRFCFYFCFCFIQCTLLYNSLVLPYFQYGTLTLQIYRQSLKNICWSSNEQSGRNFTHDIFEFCLLKTVVFIKGTPKFVLKSPIENKSALVQMLVFLPHLHQNAVYNGTAYIYAYTIFI